MKVKFRAPLFSDFREPSQSLGVEPTIFSEAAMFVGGCRWMLRWGSNGGRPMQPKYLQELIRNLQEFYKCPLPVLATVSVNGKSGSKRKSDLRQSEEAKFASKGAITASEIAEFHRWISKSKNFVKKSK